MPNLMASKKNSPLLVWGWDRKLVPYCHHSTGLLKANRDPQDEFFYPTPHS